MSAVRAPDAAVAGPDTRRTDSQTNPNQGRGQRTPEDRFFAKVQKGPHCWEWTGGLNSQGYGVFYVGGRRVAAHRWSYGFHGGTLVDGLEVEHLCHRRGCVNPQHLEQVEPWENQRRGFSPWAINARRKVCVRGHDLRDPENQYERPDGRGVQCRACIRERREEWRRRNPEQARAAKRDQERRRRQRNPERARAKERAKLARRAER